MQGSTRSQLQTVCHLSTSQLILLSYVSYFDVNPKNLLFTWVIQLVTVIHLVSLWLLIFNLLSLDPPSQIVELEDSEVNVGSTISLKCFSRGNPRPRYSWNYYRTHKVTVENEDGVSLLIIHNATGYNTGFYTCQASNVIGNVSKTVRVTVKGRVNIIYI